MGLNKRVIVIGAGVSGICAWTLLRKAGIDAHLIEAGPASVPTFAPNVETVVDDPQWSYTARGAAPKWLRTHGVGGRANLWGRWAGRFSPKVFRDGCWPYGADELDRYYTLAEEWLGVTQQPLPGRFIQLKQQFRDRVTGRIAADATDSAWLTSLRSARAKAVTSTVATRLVVVGGKVQAVELVSQGGAETLMGDHFVLAASPIESCRLLLASGSGHPEVGRNLTDHLGVGVFLIWNGTPETPNPEAAIVRMEARRPLRGGFTVEIIGPEPLRPETAQLLEADGLKIAPASSVVRILAMGEQFPSATRFLTIDKTARDALGRPRPVFHFPENGDHSAMVEEMRSTCLSIATRLAPERAQVVEVMNSVDDPRVFHPASVVIMGHDDSYPTDPYGRYREWSNVWIADASVFPSAGDCYPTLTIVAHVHRLVEALASDIGVSSLALEQV